MHIGLTYDLRQDYLAQGYGEEETAEFDSPATIEALEAALRGLGHEPERIGNIHHLTRRLALGSRWDLDFNIAEGLHGAARESQVPALLDAFQIPYSFSDPLVLGVTLHKAMTKCLVRARGVATAPFAVVERPADCEAVGLPYPLFLKPVAEGTGKGITPASRVSDARQLAARCAELLERYRQPVLVEQYLPGREFTVGIVGTGESATALGTMEVQLGGAAAPWAYGYDNKEHFEGKVSYRLATDAEAKRAEEVALAAWRALGCRDGGRVDLRSDAHGEPQFLEVNPLAGLHPVRSDLVILAGLLGIGYQALIGRILDSALSRIASVPGPADGARPPADSATRSHP